MPETCPRSHYWLLSPPEPKHHSIKQTAMRFFSAQYDSEQQ
jgi:hypothetical protein